MQLTPVNVKWEEEYQRVVVTVKVKERRWLLNRLYSFAVNVLCKLGRHKTAKRLSDIYKAKYGEWKEHYAVRR